jgi:hypothetical protein
MAQVLTGSQITHPMKRLATRTVVIYDRGDGHGAVVAKYHCTVAVARRLGWRFGHTHHKWVGKTRYTFHDGAGSEPCSTSRLISR